MFGHEETPYGDVAFAPDGETLATGTVDGHITLWNISDPSRPTIYSTMDDVPLPPQTSITGSIKSTRWDVTDRMHARHLDDAFRDNAGPGQFRLTPGGRAVVGAAHGSDTVGVWTLGDRPG